MRVGYYQFKPVFGEKNRNLDEIERATAGLDADLLVLPELTVTGYQFVSREEADELSEPVPDGPTCNRIAEIAKNAGTYIVTGIVEKEGDLLYNTAALIGPEGFISKYRKIHLFFEETLWFTPGNDEPEIIDVNGAKVGMLICFDWLFPEIFRVLLLRGIEIIAHPANLVLPYCQAAMQTRSIENRIFTVTANRIGTEARGGKKPLTFTGRSQVTGVRGEILSSAPKDRESLDVAKIDLSQARNKQVNDYNSVLGSRRPDMYKAVTKG